MNKLLKKLAFWSLIAITSISSFAFVSGYFEVSKNLDIFTTLFREVNIYYVDETKPGDMIEKAIDAMLKDLDQKKVVLQKEISNLGGLMKGNASATIVPVDPEIILKLKTEMKRYNEELGKVVFLWLFLLIDKMFFVL
jgi:hypothetical protein